MYMPCVSHQGQLHCSGMQPICVTSASMILVLVLLIVNIKTGYYNVTYFCKHNN